MKPGRLVLLLALVAAISLAVVWWRLKSPPPTPPDPMLMAALERYALPIQTTLLKQDTPAGDDFADLQFLKSLLSGRRVVVLGEATHGTHEFFTLKHRLIAYLVQELGFRTLAFEAVASQAAALGQYVAPGADLPQAGLEGLYCPFQTQEVLDLVMWLRRYNAAHPQAAVVFAGMDPAVQGPEGKSDQAMAQEVLRLLEAAGPDGKVVVWAHNGHASMLNSDSMGYHLKQALGDQVYIAGFEFEEGAFTGRDGPLSYHNTTFRVGPAGAGYYAFALARLDTPNVFLDFKTGCESEDLCAWLRAPQRWHDIDELYYARRLAGAWTSQKASWLGLYDGLIFVRDSTPAAALRPVCQ